MPSRRGLTSCYGRPTRNVTFPRFARKTHTTPSFPTMAMEASSSALDRRRISQASCLGICVLSRSAMSETVHGPPYSSSTSEKWEPMRRACQWAYALPAGQRCGVTTFGRRTTSLQVAGPGSGVPPLPVVPLICAHKSVRLSMHRVCEASAQSCIIYEYTYDARTLESR
jgi:hypothetical protein